MKCRIGDTVLWRGAFGTQLPQKAKVVGLEVTEEPRSKYGNEVEEVDECMIDDGCVLFILDNGHWAYSDQINLIRPESKEHET